MAKSITVSSEPWVPSSMIQMSGHRSTTESRNHTMLCCTSLRGKRSIGGGTNDAMVLVETETFIREESMLRRMSGYGVSRSDSASLRAKEHRLESSGNSEEVTTQLDGRQPAGMPVKPASSAVLTCRAKDSFLRASLDFRGLLRSRALRSASEERLLTERQRCTICLVLRCFQRSCSEARESRIARLSCRRMPRSWVEPTTWRSRQLVTAQLGMHCSPSSSLSSSSFSLLTSARRRKPTRTSSSHAIRRFVQW
mmetsp:Transcript_108919/g.351597  ORF Transcript_108919/g.351597 Transcript_108919/m.351597 type:complete len:253 (+) Transcript_108919:2779-3537(+)